MALTFTKRFELFEILRGHIVANDFRQWDDNIEGLTAYMESEKISKSYAKVPDIWQVNVHDKALLKAVTKHGLPILSKLKNNEEFGFKDLLISKKKLLRRLELVC